MTDSSRSAPLSGVGVLVTRPREQAADLIEAIRIKGGNAISFPVIEIVPRDQVAITADAVCLPPPDIAIFVSRNAVAHGLPQAAGAATAAIGSATADAIRAAGKTVEIEPRQGYDSESLLAEPALSDVSGKQVRIIRGGDSGDGAEGAGRELLAYALRKRGATVNYLSVYQRDIPPIDARLRDEIETAWRRGEINVITVMSILSLQNLITLLPEWCVQQLENMPLVTTAAGVIKEALDRFPASGPTLACGLHAGDIVDAIITRHTQI